MAQNNGFDDAPTEDDKLSLGAYTEGLAEFIASAPTPMTIAIQGGWGSGKSSAMMQVKNHLISQEAQGGAKQPFPIWFNTWQYSQFDLGENLAMTMLLAIVDKLPETDDGKAKHKLTKKIGRFFATSARKAIPLVMAATDSKMVETAGKMLLDPLNAAEPDGTTMPTGASESAQFLSDLKDSFKDTVAASGRKVVVFIDDLDRLNPARAVEVMEAIKVFLDVPDCVFVLAIDFDVVKLGVHQKYGMDQSEDGFSDEKARSFFDKIIQVPFHMPVGRYQVEQLFKDGLRATELQLKDGEEKRFIDLARNSVGQNPRSIKRLLNTFLLLSKINRKQDGAEKAGTSRSSNQNVQLFAVLCLQAGFPKAYESLAEHPELGDPSDRLTGYRGKDSSDQLADLDGSWKIPAEQQERLQIFLEDFIKAFLKGKQIDATALNDTLGQAQTTSVGTQGISRKKHQNITNPTRRRELLSGIRPTELVELAFKIERDFSGADNIFGAQSKPNEWTIRRQRKDEGGSRLGLLVIKANDIKIALEFKRPDEELIRFLQRKLDALTELLIENRPSMDQPNLVVSSIRTEDQAHNVATVMNEIYDHLGPQRAAPSQA